MNEKGIRKRILSISSPGIHFPGSKENKVDQEAYDLVRKVNEHIANVCKQHPERFGAVEEVIYALDTLKAKGVVFMANIYGKYLGDPEFEPMWKVLHDRETLVFVHAIKLPCLDILEWKEGLLPELVLDYPFDTTRTALHMVLNGVMERYRNMKVILSHADGFLPYIAKKLAVTTSVVANGKRSGEDIIRDLKRFYFDTALSGAHESLSCLLKFTSPGHVLYESDWPYLPAEEATFFNNSLDTYKDYTTGSNSFVEIMNVNYGSIDINKL
ncbi:unnamed protein product [Cunninghamella echinulata]